jgi:hypothetical protein
MDFQQNTKKRNRYFLTITIGVSGSLGKVKDNDFISDKDFVLENYAG